MRISTTLSFGAFVFLALAALAAAQQGQQQAPPPPPAVHVGQAAPDFELAYLTRTEDNRYQQTKVKLSDFKGKKNVVLAFYPAAFSPGCTSEMEQYTKQSGKFNRNNTELFGLSVDSTWANMAFREKTGTPFPFLSDFNKTVTKEYGLLDEANGVARRATFVIDSKGIVQHIDVAREALDPNNAAEACARMVSIQ